MSVVCACACVRVCTSCTKKQERRKCTNSQHRVTCLSLCLGLSLSLSLSPPVCTTVCLTSTPATTLPQLSFSKFHPPLLFFRFFSSYFSSSSFFSPLTPARILCVFSEHDRRMDDDCLDTEVCHRCLHGFLPDSTLLQITV